MNIFQYSDFSCQFLYFSPSLEKQPNIYRHRREQIVMSLFTEATDDISDTMSITMKRIFLRQTDGR